MKKLIAVLIAALVVFLPICTADALAENELTVNKYSGNDGINGYFRGIDRWIFEVSAKVEGDASIGNNQVRINNLPFDNCTTAGIPGYSSCTYTGEYWPGTVKASTYDAILTLYADDNTLLKTVSNKMTVDSLAPLITFDGSPVQSKQQLFAAYTVNDVAYDANDLNKCSGLNRIEFWDGTGAAKLAAVELNTSDCKRTGTANMSLPSSKRIIIKAYDRMGHLSTQASPEFVIDNDAPQILTEFFKLTAGGNALGDYIAGGNFSADIEIKIKEAGLAASNVKADLSGFGAGNAAAANSCNKPAGSDTYTCVWNNVNVQISSTKTVSITFSAEDNLGNTASATASKTFMIDNVQPQITFIGTSHVFGNTSYIGNNPADVIVKLTESGAGMSNRYIFLDLSKINDAYGTRSKADTCNQTAADEWTCKWLNRTTTKSHGYSALIIALTGTADNAGNAATGMTTGTIRIDKAAPVVNEPYARAVAEVEIPIGIIASNDEVVVTVNGTEETEVRAYGNFSLIYDHPGMLEANCQKGNASLFACTWDIESVMSGYLKKTVPLVVEDIAGNNVVKLMPIEIFARDNETNPDYWRVSSISLMPKALDRQTVPLIRQRVYAAVNLISNGATPVDIKLGECTGDSGYLNDKALFGNATPYIMLEFKTFDASSLNKLNLTCVLKIVSVYNNKLSSAETEEVKLTIPFYNLPIGEASSQVNKKIDDLVDNYIDGWWKWIGGLTTFLKYSQIICNLIAIVQNVVAFLKSVGSINAATTEAISAAFPPSAPAVRAQQSVFNIFHEGTREGGLKIFEVFDKYCAFINCKMSPVPEGTRTAGLGAGLEKWTSSFGGGSGLFGSNTMGKLPFASSIQKYTGKEPRDYMNARDSIVVSLLTLCVPGIIYNLNKYRQIQCMYIDCLLDSVKTGTPANACDKVKEYETCKYFVGEIFQLLPITAVWNYYMTLIKNVLSNPLSIVGAVLGYICMPAAAQTLNVWAYPACAYVKIFDMIGEIIQDVSSIIDKDTWNVKNDYCHKVEDAVKDRGKKVKTKTTTGGNSTAA